MGYPSQDEGGNGNPPVRMPNAPPVRNPPPESALNRQVGGDHYKQGIQPVEFIQANNLNFFEGSAVKYITRHRKKNGREDLEKAIHYLQMLIEFEYAEEKAEPKAAVEEAPIYLNRRIVDGFVMPEPYRITGPKCCPNQNVAWRRPKFPGERQAKYFLFQCGSCGVSYGTKQESELEKAS